METSIIARDVANAAVKHWFQDFKAREKFNMNRFFSREGVFYRHVALAYGSDPVYARFALYAIGRARHYAAKKGEDPPFPEFGQTADWWYAVGGVLPALLYVRVDLCRILSHTLSYKEVVMLAQRRIPGGRERDLEHVMDRRKPPAISPGLRSWLGMNPEQPAANCGRLSPGTPSFHDDGPSLGAKEWYQNLHHKNDPAGGPLSATKDAPVVGKKSGWLEELPAAVPAAPSFHDDGPSLGAKEWYRNGYLHRTNGPAGGPLSATKDAPVVGKKFRWLDELPVAVPAAPPVAVPAAPPVAVPAAPPVAVPAAPPVAPTSAADAAFHRNEIRKCAEVAKARIKFQATALADDPLWEADSDESTDSGRECDRPPPKVAKRASRGVLAQLGYRRAVPRPRVMRQDRLLGFYRQIYDVLSTEFNSTNACRHAIWLHAMQTYMEGLGDRRVSDDSPNAETVRVIGGGILDTKYAVENIRSTIFASDKYPGVLNFGPSTPFRTHVCIGSLATGVPEYAAALDRLRPERCSQATLDAAASLRSKLFEAEMRVAAHGPGQTPRIGYHRFSYLSGRCEFDSCVSFATHITEGGHVMCKAHAGISCAQPACARHGSPYVLEDGRTFLARNWCDAHVRPYWTAQPL